MELFSKLEPEVQWYFLIGVDSLMDLDNWKNVHRILNSCKLIVYSRAGYTVEEVLKQKHAIEQKYNKEIVFLDMPLIDVSSTSVRDNIKKGRNVNYLLPRGVEEIINKFQLYR